MAEVAAKDGVKPRAGTATTTRAEWSNKIDDYKLLETIGYGATAIVQAAQYLPRDEKVAIKRIDLEKCGADIEEMRREIQTMSRCHHENVVNYYTSFIVKQELWIVMKLLDGGSVLDIIKHLTKSGKVDPLQGVLQEDVIATILLEVLKGLEYFHKNGHIHRDVKAGNILLGGDGSVQIADFGVSSTVVEHMDRGQNLRTTFVGTPCWMAPEVMEQATGYNHKVDIWSFGITAIELATGTAPYAQFPAMKVLMLTLEGEPPTLETCANGEKEAYKRYGKPFRKMISQCLQKEPQNRPDATELLKNQFFRSKAKGKEFLIPNLIHLVPRLSDRGQRKPKKPQSGSASRNADGEWEFDADCGDDDAMEVEPSKEPNVNGDQKEKATDEATPQNNSSDASVATAPQQQKPNTTAAPTPAIPAQQPPVPDDPNKVYDLTLRLRNGQKELNDIQFEFNRVSDTVEGVAQELMSAGLIDGQDLLLVGANLTKIITSPPDNKQLVFALKSAQDISERDEKVLIGYAMLTLNN
jgi:serine/threonine-protein kinase OSR1/STK39